MAITTINDIVSGLASRQTIRFWKPIAAPKAVGAFQSSWLTAGNPAAGATPPAYNAGAGYTCDRTTTGALTYANAAVQNWLARAFASLSLAGTLIIADRLWSCSGMGFAAATYTVTTPGNLPARIVDGGVGCELWVEQFAGAGAATGTLTVNYKDEGGNAGAGVITALVSSPSTGQMQPVPMAAGDLGVSQLVSCVNNNSWVSGTWGMTILKRLAEFDIPISGVGRVFDWAGLALPQIPSDACLMAFIMASSTTAPNLIGRLDIIDK